MVKPEWGTKRTCRKCATNFYDMKREPIVCPKCSSTFSPSDFTSRYIRGHEKGESSRNSKYGLEDDTTTLLEEEALEEEDLLEEDDFEEEVSLIDRETEEEER